MRAALAVLACLALASPGCRKSGSSRSGHDDESSDELVRRGPESEHRSPRLTGPSQRQATGCSLENVQAVVRPHLKAVTRCYRKAVHKDRTRAGRLVVEIVVDRAGTAKFLGVKEDQIGDHDMTRCIFAVLKPLAYPFPKKPPCTILYPFKFSAGGPAARR